MDIRENIQIGWRGLLSHKMRSMLTMLGIIFGVAAVIAMVSIGEGARLETIRQIELMGTNTIRVKAVTLEGIEKDKAKMSYNEGLTRDDADHLSQLTPLIKFVVPLKETELKVRLGSIFPKSKVVATTPLYPELTHFQVKTGRFINQDDMKNSQKVCILGADVAKTLFPLEDPLHQEIKIGNLWFTVVGVMQDRRVSGGIPAASLRDVNKDVYIPLDTALQRIGGVKNMTEIILQLTDSKYINEVAHLVTVSLNRRHNNVEDYEMIIPDELLRQSQKTQKIFNIVMGAIAGISLLVGGIGIMNIMLATVTQRTREIGIRRAIGASRRDILGQFLIECLIIAVTGGLIGVLLGVGLSKIISIYAKWTTIVSFKAIFMAFGISAAVGIIFGMYPARKAADLNPVDALRYE
jgi:putative ABC transport system permease protein